MFCQECGQAIVPEAKFCMSCGAPVTAVPGTAATSTAKNGEKRGALRLLISSLGIVGLILFMGVCSIISNNPQSSSSHASSVDPARKARGGMIPIDVGVDQAAIVLARCSVPSWEDFPTNEARYMEYRSEGVGIWFTMPADQPAPRHWVINRFEDLQIKLGPDGHPQITNDAAARRWPCLIK